MFNLVGVLVAINTKVAIRQMSERLHPKQPKVAIPQMRERLHPKQPKINPSNEGMVLTVTQNCGSVPTQEDHADALGCYLKWKSLK